MINGSCENKLPISGGGDAAAQREDYHGDRDDN